MKYLEDSCVFIDRANEREVIFNIALHCKRRGETIAISQQILDELYPGKRLPESVKIKGIAIHESVQGAIDSKLIELIRIDKTKEIQDKYKEIRKRFYGWMTTPAYISQLIKDGKITREEAKSKAFRHKDEGECTLIAIALLDPENNIIITEDKGRVYIHPEQNLFDTYMESDKISVMDYSEWADHINYE